MHGLGNPQLETIEHKENLLSLDKKGRFFHPTLGYRPTIKVLLNWRKGRKKFKKEKKKDNFTLPITQPKEFFSSKKDGILWISHASFFIRLNGVTYLTDPVYYKLPLIRTISKLPKIFSQLPPIDYILLSHDHRDHLDVRTLKKLVKLNPNIKILTGLGMRPILEKLRFHHIQTAGWYQKYNIGEADIYFLPARHRCKRTLLDTNKRLWGSFIITSGGKTIYFGGDSGYEAHFKEIGELFPDIDYALIGIGGYEAKWFIHPNHTSPEEALDAAKDLQAKCFIPMHYGTFDVTNEPAGQPLRFLKKETEKRNCKDSVKILGLGESVSWN